jgi:2-C-methyl-D-erythritol 4-phosphate cytidylyltransferase
MPDTSAPIAQPGFTPRCFALVPCAGVGERAGVGGPKQYHPLAGRSVVAHTLSALAAVPRIEGILVVLAPNDTQFEDHAGSLARDARCWAARVGGASRAESVAAGLDVLIEQGAQPHDWVLVHDAARCLTRPELIDQLIAACEDDEVGGLLALPVADTLKHEGSGDDAGRVERTLSRAHTWAAQTPQMFRLGLLRPALLAALSHPESAAAITDEASAVERLGHAPKLVVGALDNFKLTWLADFALAEQLLAAR